MSMYATDYDNDTADWCDDHANAREHCGCRLPADAGLLQAIKSGDWLGAQTFPAVTWAVPDVLPEGYSLLIGGPKKGKSWLVLHLCLAVADGGMALGCVPVERRRVLYLALEDGERRLQDRIRLLRGSGPFPDTFHYATEIEHRQVINTVNAWMTAHPDTALLVLDTLGKVMPPAKRGQTTYERDYEIGSALKKITAAHPGLSLVVVHHDRKAKSGDFVDSVSGTNGLAGAADTILYLARERHATDGILSVTGRDVMENDYAITLRDGVQWQMHGGNLSAAQTAASEIRDGMRTANLGADMQRILEHVRTAQTGTRAADVAEATGIDKGKCAVYLKRLDESGHIHRLERGLYAPKGVLSCHM